MFDIAVIGIGMIGSAALRHLSALQPGLRVVGIGPAEPSDWAAHGGAFASHYDQARITRVTDPDPIWAALAQRSLARYNAIETASGITFHAPVGHLRVSPHPDGAGDMFNAAEAVGRELGAPIERLNSAQLAARLPYLKLPPGAEGLYEGGGAGCINPRALVAAQLAIAADQGATIVRDEVRQLLRERDGWTLITSGTTPIQATSVLISAHGYSNSLLRPPSFRPLDLVNQAHTTVYAELSPEAAAPLAHMPSLIWRLAGHPVLPSVYTTPPQLYGDGRIYLKIGGPLHTPLLLDSPEAIRAWFHGPGNASEIAALQEVLLDLIPGLHVRRWASKPCMNSYTVHDHPYIDQLADELFVCTGGCGSAAKSSDEIGRIGALLALHGTWHSDLPASSFHAAYTSLPFA